MSSFTFVPVCSCLSCRLIWSRSGRWSVIRLWQRHVNSRGERWLNSQSTETHCSSNSHSCRTRCTHTTPCVYQIQHFFLTRFGELIPKVVAVLLEHIKPSHKICCVLWHFCFRQPLVRWSLELSLNQPNKHHKTWFRSSSEQVATSFSFLSPFSHVWH